MKLEGSTDAKRAGVASRDCSRVAERVEDSDTHRDDGAGIRDVYGVTVGLVNVGIAFEGKRKITKARIGNLVGHCQSGIEPVRKERDVGVVGRGQSWERCEEVGHITVLCAMVSVPATT